MNSYLNLFTSKEKQQNQCHVGLRRLKQKAFLRIIELGEEIEGSLK